MTMPEDLAAAIARAERAEARVAELEAELDEEEKATAHKHDLLRDAWDDRDEWRTRADRAEAACARMRAALETARSVIGHVCKVEWSSEMRCFACLYDTALATDIGSGWVSPESYADREQWWNDAMSAYAVKHAEVVAERTARAEKAESERDAVLRAKTTNDLELVRVQKRLATVTKERDEARAEHHRTCQAVALGEERLVERVRLLEAVVENVRLHGCRHIVAGSVTANCTGRVCRALAALDAYDAQGKADSRHGDDGNGGHG